MFSLDRDKNNKFFHIGSEFDLQDFDDYPKDFQSTHVSGLDIVPYAKETPGSLWLSKVSQEAWEREADSERARLFTR